MCCERQYQAAAQPHSPKDEKITKKYACEVANANQLCPAQAASQRHEIHTTTAAQLTPLLACCTSCASTPIWPCIWRPLAVLQTQGGEVSMPAKSGQFLPC